MDWIFRKGLLWDNVYAYELPTRVLKVMQKRQIILKEILLAGSDSQSVLGTVVVTLHLWAPNRVVAYGGIHIEGISLLFTSLLKGSQLSLYHHHILYDTLSMVR